MIERSYGLGANRLVWESAGTQDGSRSMSPADRGLVQQRLERALQTASRILMHHKASLLSLAIALLDQRHMTVGEIALHLPNGTTAPSSSDAVLDQPVVPLDTSSLPSNLLFLGE